MADHERSSTKHQRSTHLGQSRNLERSGKSAHVRPKISCMFILSSFHIFFFFSGLPTRTRRTCMFFLLNSSSFIHLDTSVIGLVISSEDRHLDSHKFENRSDRDDSYGSFRTVREERAPHVQLDRGRRSQYDYASNHRYSEPEVSKTWQTISVKLKITVHTIIGSAFGFKYEGSSLDFTWSSH